MSPARRTVPNAFGSALIEALTTKRDAASLELLWRAAEPDLAARLASPIASLEDPHLGALLLSELASPQMSVADVRPDIRAAIESHLPPLTPQAIDVLDSALRDGNASDLVPNRADQELFERWLFAQSGPAPDEYALFVLANDAEQSPDPATKKAALDRCAASDDLRRRAADAYRTRLDTEQDSESWEAAAHFVEAACSPTNKQAEVIALVRELIMFAPVLLEGQLDPSLAALIRRDGFPTVKEILSRDKEASASVGMTALLEIADSFPSAAKRLEIFTLAYSRHPALWRALEPLVTDWKVSRWPAVLRWLLRSRQADLPTDLSPLVALAPQQHAAMLVHIAIAHRPDDAELRETVGSKAFDAYMTAGQEGGKRSTVVWWPIAGDQVGQTFLAV